MYGLGQVIYPQCGTGGLRRMYNDFSNIVSNMDAQQRVPGISSFAGPSKGWNDLDMMHVGYNWGKSVLTDIEAQSEISFKAILKSPYLVSCDIEKLTKTQLNMLRHPEVLAIHQDAIGEQATRLWYSGPVSSDVSHQECVTDEIAGVQHRQLKWDVERFNGTSMLISRESGMCLSVAGCSIEPGTSVKLCPCNGPSTDPDCSNATCATRNRMWSFDAGMRHSGHALLSASIYGYVLRRYSGSRPFFCRNPHVRCDQRQSDVEGKRNRWRPNALEGIAMPYCGSSYYPGVLPDLYAGRLSGGDVAVALFNRNDATQSVGINLSALSAFFHRRALTLSSYETSGGRKILQPTRR